MVNPTSRQEAPSFKTEKFKEKFLSKEWHDLMKARYKNWPEGYFVLINRAYSKEEILNHIKQKDEIYELLCKVEEEYFNSLKDGSLTKFVQEKE